MRLKYLGLICLAATLVLVSCKGKVTKKAFKTGDVLKASINGFENNRQKFSEKVTTTIEEAEATFQEEGADLQEIAVDWEKEWTKIQKQYNKLKTDFEKVGGSSIAYFEQLNDLSSGIQNEELRNKELAANKVLEDEWSVTYQDAKESIEKVTEVLDAGNDFHRVLVATSVRSKIEQNVTELESIASQAKELLKDLEVFTEEGRKLVEG